MSRHPSRAREHTSPHAEKTSSECCGRGSPCAVAPWLPARPFLKAQVLLDATCFSSGGLSSFIILSALGLTIFSSLQPPHPTPTHPDVLTPTQEHSDSCLVPAEMTEQVLCPGPSSCVCLFFLGISFSDAFFSWKQSMLTLFRECRCVTAMTSGLRREGDT